ncbi:Atg7p, partial [Ascoidea rubescens DSM 1968]
QSFVNSSFFTKLSNLKLDVIKLDSSPVPIYGSCDIISKPPRQAPIINLNSTSFSSLAENLESLPTDSCFLVKGEIKNVNTIEEFKTCDKQQFLNDLCSQLLDSFTEDRRTQILENPYLLNTFKVLSFSDLKKYKFYYWFCFPSLYLPWNIVETLPLNSKENGSNDSNDYQLILKNIKENWWNNNEINNLSKQFFILDKNDLNPILLKNILNYDLNNQEIVFGMIDSSTVPNKPSWNLRNFLAFLNISFKLTKIKILIFRINYPTLSYYLTTALPQSDNQITKNIGWERKMNNKLGLKLADLGSLIDPIQLAAQSNDLNLKLMKWRIIPEINLDIIKQTKCLLLGAGTLGSYVSRALMAWGVQNITFVDNGKVSFSNPVRQPLYKFDDCINGGKFKSLQAAQALKEILPTINSKGYNLEVPMIGHPIKNYNTEKQNYEQLYTLIQNHDVIFLLMDSRETRWLPTVIANVLSKTVINVALGFDSYLVLRHGCIKPEALESQDLNESRLGCYFCNDVVAPSDSLKDRTLDQMCTVTRPGVALLASSLAVELLVSILHHPKKQFANSIVSTKHQPTILGDLPHQIRGFLHNFENIKLSAQNYKYCSACSLNILKEFKDSGWDFVVKALNDYKYIEDLSGLTKVQQEAEEAALQFE